eukprot:COSAG03_NODE_857_length_5606_cov_136.971854_1_plen_436_part_00
MPITPEFSYQETETLITVNVSLLGASPKNCDVFVSDVLLKINKNPHLLVLDLHAAVDDNTSTVSFTPAGVTVNLRKARAAMWGVLKADPALLGGKEGVAKRREASIERQRVAANAVRQQRLTAQSAHKRLATHAGIDLDRAQRQLIDDRKAAEKAKAEAEMYAALEAAENERAQPTEEPSWEEVEGEDAEEGEDGMWEEVDAAEAEEAQPAVAAVREPEPEPQLAPVRSYKGGHIAPVKYTKSKQPEHLQHLPARTKPEDMPSAETAIKPIDDDAVDLGEQNALFLKDRGDGFFGRRDYEAAVNAYSAALTLDRDLPAVSLSLSVPLARSLSVSLARSHSVSRSHSVARLHAGLLQPRRVLLLPLRLRGMCEGLHCRAAAAALEARAAQEGPHGGRPEHGRDADEGALDREPLAAARTRAAGECAHANGRARRGD